MICPKCNKQTKKAKFCTHCGENLEEHINAKKQAKADKFMKFKLKLLLILFIIFALLLSSIIALNIYFSERNFINYKVAIKPKSIEPVIDTNNTEDLIIEESTFKFELTEENKNEDYDRDNLTNEQEIALGTHIYFEDTDGDGLNDGAEVNNYKSNPLKASTSDDGISDYVKAKKSLDFNTVYDASTIPLENININSRITLIPSDLESQVTGTFREFSKDNNVNSTEDVFSVYSFKGKIEYILEKVNVVLLVEYNNQYTEFDDYTLKADKLIINIDSEDDNAKNFVITTKENYQNYLKGGNS